MGAKFEAEVLSDMENKDILISIAKTLYDFGWLYNHYDFGRNTVWEEPIWKLGKSKTNIEQRTVSQVDIESVLQTIKNISDGYSQSMIFHKRKGDRIIPLTLSIVESSCDTSWKTVSIVWDVNDLNKRDDLREIKNIFIDEVKCLRPYYGMAAIEMMGLVEVPNDLTIDLDLLGHLNYFSCACSGFELLDDIDEKYECIDLPDMGKLLISKDCFSQIEIGSGQLEPLDWFLLHGGKE